MSTRPLKICLMREGLTEENSLLLLVDVGKDEVTCLNENEEYIFQHITDKKKSTIAEIQDTYAKMFHLHNLNILGLDADFSTIFLFKIDGTTKEYTG